MILKRTPIRKVSKKMARQRILERKLSRQLLELCGNRCEICHNPPDFRGLHKHEIIKRSHNGSAIDPLNTLMICLNCHNHVKYPNNGTPLSVNEQLELAKKLHNCLLDKCRTL